MILYATEIVYPIVSLSNNVMTVAALGTLSVTPTADDEGVVSVVVAGVDVAALSVEFASLLAKTVVIEEERKNFGRAENVRVSWRVGDITVTAAGVAVVLAVAVVTPVLVRKEGAASKEATKKKKRKI